MRTLLPLLVVAGCSSLSSYDPNPPGVDATGTGSGSGNTGTGTGATATGTGTGAGTGTGTGDATGTGTGAPATGTGSGGWGATGSGSGTGTGTGGGSTSGTGGTGTGTGAVVLPPGPLVDGTYVGTVEIFYELLVPLIGGSNTCYGDVTIVVDQTLVPPISGTISNCQFGPLAFLLAGVDDVNGTFDGYNPVYGTVSGWMNTTESSGTFEIDDAWYGVVTTGPRIVSDFNGNNIFVDRWTGHFDATWAFP